MRTLCLFALLAAQGPQDPPASPKHNVLFIAVDDLRPALGCYGNPLVKSPHLDRLASAGVRFDLAFCQYPLCNPSRASLLTGRLPKTTQIMDNTTWIRTPLPDVVTLNQHFRAHGYATLRSGKIYHGGLDDDKGWVEGGEPLNPPKPRTPEENERRRRSSDRWEALEGPEENVPDARNATRAIGFLEKHREKPFFLALGFSKPHTPFLAPKRYFDLYDPAGIKLPPDFAPRPTPCPGAPREALTSNGDIFIQRDAGEPEARQMIAAYYACTSFIDAQVGRVLEAVDRLGLREKTVVVFFGDHGFHLGEKGKWSKHGSLFDVGTRVPLIVAAPGLSRGRACGRTVELLDLYPTLVDLCGLPVPPGLEGKSLKPLLRDPDAAWDKPARAFAKHGKVLGRAVRTERYRFVDWGSEAELYDHSTDPHEMKNLAADPAHAETVKALRPLLP
jgi:arylsulfatase A-like enzyme